MSSSSSGFRHFQNEGLCLLWRKRDSRITFSLQTPFYGINLFVPLSGPCWEHGFFTIGFITGKGSLWGAWLVPLYRGCGTIDGCENGYQAQDQAYPQFLHSFLYLYEGNRKANCNDFISSIQSDRIVHKRGILRGSWKWKREGNTGEYGEI